MDSRCGGELKAAFLSVGKFDRQADFGASLAAAAVRRPPQVVVMVRLIVALAPILLRGWVMPPKILLAHAIYKPVPR